MRANYAVWIGLFIIEVLVTPAARYYPHLPGGLKPVQKEKEEYENGGKTDPLPMNKQAIPGLV
jgi:hypothetical protein